MVDYALARDRCIGMIQTDERNDLYKIGCIGKIHSFNETNDGRYLISLKGTNCFKVISELDKNFNFRLVNCEKINNDENLFDLSHVHKNELLNKYKKYMKIKNINLNLEEIESIELSQLIKFIAMISPFKNEDKQILLETSKLFEFYKRLISIIELELVGDITKRTIN